MRCCFCKSSSNPKKHLSIIECIQSIFEIESIRLICVLGNEGRVLSLYTREDISSSETHNLLEKASAIKSQCLKLSTLQNEKSRSLHIQGNHTSCSMFDLPDQTQLVYFLDCNPLTSEMTYFFESRAYLQAKIAELFGKA